MTRRCTLTGKIVRSGQNVSHAENKTKRTFRPNLKWMTLESASLGGFIRLRISTSTLRTIDSNGGLESWLLGEHKRNLTPEALRLRGRIERFRQARAAATTE